MVTRAQRLLRGSTSKARVSMPARFVSWATGPCAAKLRVYASKLASHSWTLTVCAAVSLLIMMSTTALHGRFGHWTGLITGIMAGLIVIVAMLLPPPS